MKKTAKRKGSESKKITKMLKKMESIALSKISKLKNSKARGKTLIKQRESTASYVAYFVKERDAHNRKTFKKGFFEKFIAAGSEFLSDFSALSAPIINGKPLYSSSTTNPRSRAGYKELVTIEICPDFAPMQGKYIGVSERGVIVEQAMLAAQKAFNSLSTNRSDIVTCDFPLASRINYPDGRGTQHYSFIDARIGGACLHYIKKMQEMANGKDTANVEIVFPINLHLLIKQA